MKPVPIDPVHDDSPHGPPVGKEMEEGEEEEECPHQSVTDGGREREGGREGEVRWGGQ